jgi:hypothetical protein
VQRRQFACIAIAGAIGAAAHADTGVIAAGVERDRVAREVALAIGEHVIDDAVTVARAARAAGAVPIDTLARFRRVRETIDEGWRAYTVNVQYDYAASRLGDARTAAEPLVVLPGGALVYADAALRLGAVLARLGRGDDAQAVLALALALDPDRAVTTAEFSPDVVAAVDAARAAAPTKQRVRVAVEPPGAAISIDGVEVGHAPLDVELARGQHVIVARAPQHRARAQAVAVGEATRDVALALDRDDDAVVLATGAVRGLPDSEAQHLVDAALRYAELDELALVAATERRGGPALLVQRCAGAPARCSAIVEIGYGDRAGLRDAARAAWQAARAGELRYPPSVLADPRFGGDRVVEHRCRVCRSPWLWGSVGVAAVVGTIAIVAVATAAKPAPVVGISSGAFVAPR